MNLESLYTLYYLPKKQMVQTTKGFKVCVCETLSSEVCHVYMS